MNKAFKSLLLAAGLAVTMMMAMPNTAKANPVITPTVVQKLTCPDYNLGRQLLKVCYHCMFPMTIMGAPIGPRSRLPNDRAGPFCFCKTGKLGIPAFGSTIGWWDPKYTVEMVRNPWCMPSFGGRIMGSGVSGLLPSRHGGQSTTGEDTEDSGAYYNFHMIKFPVTYLLGFAQSSVCSKGNNAIDIGFMSEFDPSWNNDILAVWTGPEAKLFAGPWSYIACAADAVAASTVKPINKAFWCAGAWGHIYPLSGNLPSAESGPNEASLGSAKAMARMHRYMVARKTYGRAAVCRDRIHLTLPKQQYRMQQLFPLGERNNHWLGASTFRWGEWRSLPAVGEDYVYMGFSYNECCVTWW